MYLWICYFVPVISQRYIKYTLVQGSKNFSLPLDVTFDVAIATLENLLQMTALNKRLNKTDMEKVG